MSGIPLALMRQRRFLLRLQHRRPYSVATQQGERECVRVCDCVRVCVCACMRVRVCVSLPQPPNRSLFPFANLRPLQHAASQRPPCIAPAAAAAAFASRNPSVYPNNYIHQYMHDHTQKVMSPRTRRKCVLACLLASLLLFPCIE